MEVKLEVIEGPHKGKIFSFHEADNFLVGRDAPGSNAHFRLSPEDRYVSRNHFLVEVRPPKCYIRDNGSKNGTFVKKSGEKDWCKVKVTELSHGDLVKVGRTVLAVNIVEEAEKFHCLQCGTELTDLSNPLCPACQKKKLKARRVSASKYFCFVCRKEVPEANADGRAESLNEAALYLCASCAKKLQAPVKRKKVGDYLLLKEIGRGGFGVVYQARHEPTSRLVALKLIETHMDEKSALRFHREIKIMENLVHPHIVRLFDQGNDQGLPWYACEFCSEGSLHDLYTKTYRGPLPVEEACRLVCQALDGVAYAHEKGYVHRDLKPPNILLIKRKGTLVAKVADFGLAKSLDSAGLPSVTRTGDMAGTPLFMPPEQFWDFKNVKPPADVYAMGITLYILLTGKFPFEFPSPLEQILKGRKVRDPVEIVLHEEPIPVEKRKQDLPPGLANVVNRAIRKNVSARFSSAAEFRAALEKVIKGGRQ